MSWLLVGGAALAGALLVVVGVGAALPRAHVASRAARLPAPPERVWALLTDVAAYPRWRGDVTAVELLPPRDGRAAWRETSRHGKITFETTEADPPRRLVSRIADAGLPFGGAWEYQLTPDGVGTRIVVTERGEVYNPVFRFVSRFVMGHTATIDAFLRALGRALGTDVVPADAPVAAAAATAQPTGVPRGA
jgi:uncharacterized protein YndB with AHSA1/START domain